MLSVVFAALALGAQGSSMYIASKCRGQKCTDPNFPILDYVAQEDKCVCAANPCWNDNGRQHDCSLESGLHLAFSYTPDGNLTCSCQPIPLYTSVHIAKDLCPGQHCNELHDFPVLDWDPAEKRCLCRANPCWNEPGARDKCKDPLFPILLYREDHASEGAAPVCECIARANKPKEEPKPSTRLRGSNDEGRSQIMILSNGDRCATPRSSRRNVATW